MLLFLTKIWNWVYLNESFSKKMISSQGVEYIMNQQPYAGDQFVMLGS